MMDQQRQEAFAAFRKTFPGTADVTYLDVAARGLISRPVRQAMDAYLDARMQGGADKAWMFDRAEGARAGFARLIGARDDERTPAGQTEALFAAAGEPKVLRWTEGQHVEPGRPEVIRQLLSIAYEELPHLTTDW